MKNILYINSTVREHSRTDELARCLLEKLAGKVTERKLEKEDLQALNHDLLRIRNGLLKNADYENEKLKQANEFAKADTIVIAAPFWDMSFPALLKIYIENICVTGVTFKYSEAGEVIGLCQAKDLYFVSTAGGKFVPDFGFDYVKSLCQNLWGIENVNLIFAEGLDMVGNNPAEILQKAKSRMVI